MHIIPVIDLKGGCAVGAYRGQRRHYRKLDTRLCPNGSVHALVASYTQLYNLNTLYIADLDAIEKTGSNAKVIADLVAAWPNCTFWCDTGTPPPLHRKKSQNQGGKMLTVWGSESQPNQHIWDRMRPSQSNDFILSLDFEGDKFRGPAWLKYDTAGWPRHLIVMTLDRVGTQNGPAHTLLQTIIAQAKNRRVYAAGGIRHAQDLTHLARLGVYGALVATALHTGDICPALVRHYSPQTKP